MKKNPQLIQVFLDLSAEYDMVDRRILWTMLRNRFKMPIGMIKLLRSLFDSNYSRLESLELNQKKYLTYTVYLKDLHCRRFFLSFISFSHWITGTRKFNAELYGRRIK